jgi:hypothetical protein
VNPPSYYAAILRMASVIYTADRDPDRAAAWKRAKALAVFLVEK